jgi:hypothetical protein
MSPAHRSAFAVLFATLSATGFGAPAAADEPRSEPGIALTPAQTCAVAAAKQSGDPRQFRIAREVLRGKAGVVALADPWILHHHRLDTSRQCR